MEFFNRAKEVRLKSQHNRYLFADSDEQTIRQSTEGSSKNARWTVEHVDGKKNIIRLKSCHWNYLAASNDPYLLGLTGKKITLVSPRLRSEEMVEWEPIKEGVYLKLRTKKGKFLRANGGMPPYRSSVTHDLPKRTASQDWALWKVDVLDIHHGEMGVMEEEEVVDVVEKRGLSVKPTVVDEGSPAGSYRSENSFKQAAETLSRTSSTASNCTSPMASNRKVHPSSHRIQQDSKSLLSNSFKHLESMVSNAHELQHAQSKNSSSPKYACESPTSHPFEVRMAKQIINDVKDMDFNSLLSSDRLKRVEKAITILSSEEDNLNTPRLHPIDRFRSLKSDHKSATNDLTEYTVFSSKKQENKKEFQKDVARANELESIEIDCRDKLASASARKEELLEELQGIEERIKEAEEIQDKNAVAIDELIMEISEKSENLKEMEKEGMVWQSRKDEAERKLEEIEDDWVKMKKRCQGA